MSVEDETWDRPICEFCNCKIHYGDHAFHLNGKCLDAHSKLKPDIKKVLKRVLPSEFSLEIEKISNDKLADLVLKECWALEDLSSRRSDILEEVIERLRKDY